MKLRRILILAGMTALLVSMSTSYQSLFASDEVWKAAYWNNTDLEGDPVLQRDESGLNNDWGGGSPADVVNSSNFSARWETKTDFDEGTYRFTATVDDGMRVYVDDERIIDVWYDSQEHTVSADHYMSDGEHKIVVEYYEAEGDAVAKLDWQRIGGQATSSGIWTAQYY